MGDIYKKVNIKKYTIFLGLIIADLGFLYFTRALCFFSVPKHSPKIVKLSSLVS